jgi:hypothetical protein
MAGADPMHPMGDSDRPMAAGFTLVGATATILGRRPMGVQEDEQVLMPFTVHNDVVVVPGDRARQVVTELERAGVEGDRISFLRLDRDSLSPSRDATPQPGLDVGPIGQTEERSVVVLAAIGAVVGAIVVGALVWLLTDGETALWAALGGLALGGALGALWGSFRRLGASDAWERSLHVDPGARAAVAVHLDDIDGNGRVTEILTPHGLWVFAADGSVLRRPNTAAPTV